MSFLNLHKVYLLCVKNFISFSRCKILQKRSQTLYISQSRDTRKISLVELPLPRRYARTRAQFVSFPVRNLHISYSLILSAPRYQETNYKCPGSWNELWKLCVGNCEMGTNTIVGHPRKRGAGIFSRGYGCGGREKSDARIRGIRAHARAQVRMSKLGHFGRPV